MYLVWQSIFIVQIDRIIYFLYYLWHHHNVQSICLNDGLYRLHDSNLTKERRKTDSPSSTITQALFLVEPMSLSGASPFSKLQSLRQPRLTWLVKEPNDIEYDMVCFTCDKDQFFPGCMAAILNI